MSTHFITVIMHVVWKELGHPDMLQHIKLMHYFDEIMLIGPTEQELSSTHMPS